MTILDKLMKTNKTSSITIYDWFIYLLGIIMCACVFKFLLPAELVRVEMKTLNVTPTQYGQMRKT